VKEVVSKQPPTRLFFELEILLDRSNLAVKCHLVQLVPELVKFNVDLCTAAGNFVSESYCRQERTNR